MVETLKRCLSIYLEVFLSAVDGTDSAHAECSLSCSCQTQLKLSTQNLSNCQAANSNSCIV
jgi:hypothetical protein